MASWADLLDALEARTGDLGDALAAGRRDVTVPDLELSADGPLPSSLRLRAQVLLAATRRLEREIEQRTGASARAAATYASH